MSNASEQMVDGAIMMSVFGFKSSRFDLWSPPSWFLVQEVAIFGYNLLDEDAVLNKT